MPETSSRLDHPAFSAARRAAPPAAARSPRRLAWLLPALLAACASQTPLDEPPPLTPAEGRARVSSLLPPGTPDRAGWATDIYAAFAAMELLPSAENICAVLAVTEQESGFRADPTVANLAAITRKEIDARAERLGIPALAVRAALALPSPNGRSYAERIDAARTEQELSRIFEDFVGMVPLGKRLFAGWNPVRTGGPMQVSIAYAEQHARERPYPYSMEGSLRDEVFSRRGGMYFGIAHLLDYPAAYERHLYRYADFNAGHYASRNAAFQQAVSSASGIPLDLDGDLIRHDADAERPGATELATRVLGKRLGLSDAEIRRALERGTRQDFEDSELYRRVFALADRLNGRPLPRAAMPRIRLQSPKITRRLTTEWFANRVQERYQRCIARREAAG